MNDYRQSRVPIDTHGWDIVLALPFTSVNKALAADPGLLLSRFHFVEESAENRFRADGDFGSWSLVGGSGQNLVLMLPIKAGTLEIPEGASIAEGVYDLAGTCVELVLRLRFRSTEGDCNRASLIFSCEETEQSRLIGDLVHGTGAVNMTGKHRTFVASLVADAVAKCLAANAEQVRFVFTHIAPHIAIAEDARELAYSVTEMESGGHALRIFCGVSAGNAAEISGLPAVADDRFTVAISQQIFVERMLKPTITQSLRDAQFPMRELFRNGAITTVPLECHASPYDLDVSNFQTSILSTTRAKIVASQDFPLRLLHFKEAEDFEIRKFSCDLDCGEIQITADIRKYISTDPFPFKIPISTGITLSVKTDFREIALFERRENGLRFHASEGVRTPSSRADFVSVILQGWVDEMATSLVNSLKTALEDIDLPVSISILNGTRLDIREAYLAGALCLSGPLA